MRASEKTQKYSLEYMESTMYKVVFRSTHEECTCTVVVATRNVGMKRNASCAQTRQRLIAFWVNLGEGDEDNGDGSGGGRVCSDSL